ncbi:hypothetical protein B0H11DRAFT_2219709 [Mycena galericulata]|nr:hypothetical protein B0H11DRAFT_2219709 [Mycena galericulata]
MISKAKKIDMILRMLVDAHITATDVLLATLDKPTYTASWYSKTGPVKKLLDKIYMDERGQRIVNEWFSCHALALVCEQVSSQADTMVKALSRHKSVSELTPAFLRSWSLKDTVAEPADLHASALACYTILAQIITRCSQATSDFAGPMSLMWWASGCSRETIEILCNIGLSKSFDTTQLLIKSTGNYCIEDARVLAHGTDGFLYNYDNVNFSTSIFVEQRSDAPAKGQSGTYTIIYPFRNPNPRALELPPILLCAQSAPDLDFNRDLCPTFEQSRSSHHQFCSYVVRVLCRYENQFKGRKDDLDLQSPPRRCLPAGYKTPQLPLKICTREEFSIKGNLAVHVETLVKQLGLTYPQLTKAILSINDQATQALNRGAKSIRAFDINPFLRCQVFQLGIGLFHLCLNLVWAALNVHRGHVNHHGTLSHLFVIIDKTRLGGQHPDYHSLLVAMMQILDGLLLDAWRIECGYPTLADYAASNPSAADLRAKAATILYNHGTPTRSPTNSNAATDTVQENSRRLIHDLMYVCEVTRAISAGDFGRVEDILTTLGMMFRGAGSKNYSTEIMHFTHNMKKVWPINGFDELVRDNMIDLFTAKGMYGSWERLADISAAIDVIGSVKNSIAMTLDASYSGKSHTHPDTSNLVWQIAHKARELKLNTYDPTRDVNDVVKASVDILSAGEAVLKSSSIATFNKNRKDLLRGIQVAEETDEMPPMELCLARSSDQGDN